MKNAPIISAGIIAVLSLTTIPLSAHANDSTATIELGGIVLTKQSEIEMEVEDLTVSPGFVHVEYIFKNHSDTDIDSIVAFPLPRVDMGESYFHDLAWPNPKSGNLVGFHAKSDGKDVQLTQETHAWVGDQEVSASLLDLGVPIGTGASWLYSSDLAPQLKAAGLVVQSSGEDIANWMEQTTFYWRQHFPKESPTYIEHVYNPAAGAQHISSGTNFSEYCFDKITIDRISDELRRNGYDAELLEVKYILTTANNWRGPIGDFRLTVKSPRPEILVGSCMPGLQAIDANTLEMHVRDFSPSQELTAYFIVPLRLWDDMGVDTGPNQLIPDSDKALIKQSDLKFHNAGFLRLARNEIYARHGKRFHDSLLQHWFETKKWYNPTDAEVHLSQVEATNVEIILREENGRQMTPKNEAN